MNHFSNILPYILWIVFTHAIFPIDLSVSSLVMTLENPSMTSIMNIASTVGTVPGVIISVCLSAIILGVFYGIRTGLSMLSVFIWDVANELLKFIISRPRPGHLGLTETDSFPSGHVFHSIILLGTIWLHLYPKMTRFQRTVLGFASTAVIAIVSLQRIYLDRHWPTDVVGSILIAGIILISISLVIKIRNKHSS